MRIFRIALGILVFVSLITALTAANVVPSTKAGQSAQAIDANALKPNECASLDLTAVVLGTTGGAASELILGTAAGESMRGNGGDDCILAGGGDENVRGDAGTDVCLGGPGSDTFHPSCETSID